MLWEQHTAALPQPLNKIHPGGLPGSLDTQVPLYYANASSGKLNSSTQQTESGPNSAPAMDKSFHVFLGYKNITEKYLK